MPKAERKSNKEARKPKSTDKSKTKIPSYQNGGEKKAVWLNADKAAKGTKK